MEYLPDEVSNVAKEELENFSQRQRVGSYLLGKTIGQGSFAKVKEGIHVSTGEKVAVKIINKRKAREDRYVSRNLKREAEIMQMLRHRNIVRLLEVMETDMFYYLVTELCTGGELLDQICEKKFFDEDTTRRFIKQLVSAVYTMHSAGIVHRDLKIENFLLDEDENLKIVDFGLSNVLPAAALETWDQIGMCPFLLNSHCGSPAYAAPELLAQEPYGAQVDVWSIGVNMYAMLTGNLPYTMEPFSIIDMYHKMMERKINQLPKYISQDARDLIDQFLEPIPEKRITLQKAAGHPWLNTSGKPMISSLKTAEMIANEVNQTIVLHMAQHMGMNMKEIVNSVTRNKASHSFAIYFLLKERLDKYEKRQQVTEKKSDQSFTKVKVVKKAKLQTDSNVLRSKFTYKGVKITKGSTSQPHIHEERRSTSRSDHETLYERIEKSQNIDQWNQYATFPRDRRTINANDQMGNSSAINATLDRGSDDIDYYRLSSPETTDNSASSLESQQLLHLDRFHAKPNRHGLKNTSDAPALSTGESGSDDEYCSRGRSKSLTGSEEYDHTRNLFATSGRSRTNSMANCFSRNSAETRPRRNRSSLDASSPQFVLSLKPKREEAQVIHRGSNSWLQQTVLAEDIESHIDEGETVSSNKRKEEQYVLDNKIDTNSNKENIETEPGVKSTPKHRNRAGLIEAKEISARNCVNETAKDLNFEVLREVIPPPTPFKDESSRMNIEKTEVLKCAIDSKERRILATNNHNISSSPKLERRSKKNEKRKNLNKSHGRSRSVNDAKLQAVETKTFQNIEVEKVRKIELEPLKNPTVHVAAVLQTMSPFSLNCVKQESPCNFDTSAQHVKVTTEPLSANEEEYDSHLKDRGFEYNLPKKGPFKVDFVKLAKWQCEPVFRAEVIDSSRVMRCKVDQENHFQSINEGRKETQSNHVSKKASDSDLGWHSSRPRGLKNEVKVHRSQSLSDVDYTTKLERNQIRRSERHKPRFRSQTSTDGVVLRKSSEIISRNIFIVNDPLELGSNSTRQRNAPFKAAEYQKNPHKYRHSNQKT